MKRDFVPTRAFCILSGISGIIGVLMLVVSFNINPGPPAGATMEQLDAFAAKYIDSILWGAWLQAVGPFFIVLFALAIVSFADATKHLAGMMTSFGAGVLMTVSLIEITFYITTLFKDPPVTSLIGLNIIYSVQHLYFVIGAPAIFIPLGFVILISEVLSPIFGWLAILLGLSFGLLGVLFLFHLVLPVWVTACGGIQVFWWLSASVNLMTRSRRISKASLTRT